MRIKKKKIWATLKTISRTGFIIFLCLAVFNLGALFGKYSTEEESEITFFTKTTEYKWSSTEGPPQIVTDQINDYNHIKNLVLIAVFLSFAVMFFDYFLDPEHHFVTTIKNKWGPRFKKFNEEED